MKKLFTLFVLMLTAMVVNAGSYNIWVKGIQVTDANKNDVLGDGKVKYYSDYSRLELNGANITAPTTGSTKEAKMALCIEEDITVIIRKTVTLTGNGDIPAMAIWGGHKVTFNTYVGEEGVANLVVKHSTYRAIEIGGTGSTNFWNMKVDVTGGEYGIKSEANQTLGLVLCDFSVTGSKTAVPIFGFKEIKAESTSLTSPSDLEYDSSTHYYRQNGSAYTGTIKFETEKYSITVDGIKVTARNRKYILGEKNSQVSFDPNLNELTLDNANLKTSAGIFINNSNKNTSSKTFKIKLIGTNKIVDTGYSSTLYIAPNGVDSTLIYSTSGGTLDITANNEYGALLCFRKKIAIKDCTVNLKNNNTKGSGFEGDKEYATQFSFINTNFSAETAGSNVIREVYDLQFYGCFMQTPNDGFLNSQYLLFSDSGNTQKFVVVPGKDNVKPHFTYGDTPTVKETTINSAKIGFGRAMDNLTDDKNIKYHIFLKKGEKIDGIWNKSYDLDMVISSSNLETEITGLESGVTYTLRMRATDEAGNHAFYKDIVFTTKVEDYSVIVCGTTLTSANLNEFKAKGLTYNPETKVITLENANISYNAGAAIVAGLGDYTIDLKGENTVNGSEAAIGAAFGSITITTSSNGTLSCSSTDVNSAVLSAPLGVLYIKNCKVDIYNNNGYGLSGGGLGGLKLENADVKVYGKQGCVCDWMVFEMIDCYVASPRPTEIGGTEADRNLGIYQNGAPVKGQFVEIKPGVDAINGIASDAKMDGKIYNLQGVEVDENYKGVVVKNGKKYLNK